MSDLFDRRIEVIIGNRKWSYPGLDIEFNTKFDSDSIPDESECSIFNLSRDSISSISKGQGIIINAGYGNDIGTIASAVISDVGTSQNGLDKETKIKMIDMTKSYLNKKISYNYGPGAKTDYLIKDLLSYAGNLKATVLTPAKIITYPRGFSANGRIIDILNRVVRDSGSKLQINGPSIRITPSTKGVESGFLLNSKTGLINIEKIDKTNSVSTHKIQMLLNHAIAPYSLLQVESTLLNGVVMVVEGEHKSDFTTEVEVRAL